MIQAVLPSGWLWRPFVTIILSLANDGTGLSGPVNIGSEEMVTINQLAETIMDVAQEPLRIRHVDGPPGVRGGNSDNRLIRKKPGWAAHKPLRDGLTATYHWIARRIARRIARQIG